MSNFLSNLITRSFTDVPIIQPRVPSLFETAADEFFDEAQAWEAATSTHDTNVPAPVSKTSVTKETAAMKPISRASDSIPERDSPKHEDLSENVQARDSLKRRKLKVETKKIIVPVGSFLESEKEPEDKRAVAEAFPELRPAQNRRRKDFSPVEQPLTSAPVIRVTIGRVEVRAIQPPAAVPKAKPASPKLSLEDYLGKREGGPR